MRYDKVKKNAPQVLSLTGFSVLEFESLLPAFKYEWEEYYSHYTLKGKVRERISYGRKTGKIPLIGDKLLFILSYVLLDGTERLIQPTTGGRQTEILLQR